MIGADLPRPAYFDDYPGFPDSMSDPVAVPAALNPLVTLRDFIRWGASEFRRHGLVFGHGTDNALDEAFHLVLSTCKLPFDLPAVYLETHLAADERSAVYAVLQRRVDTRMPAPYLTGISYFCGLEFEVDARALIPRSPIGELIEAQFQPWLVRDPETILDLCSGSGCIGIAAAFAFPEATVDLAEIDDGALDVIAEAPEHLTEDGVLICEIGGSDDEFEARFPGIPVAWPEFERGGDGVFVIGREELVDWLKARKRRK
jgi:methylase of polypeptide subunit release factors